MVARSATTAKRLAAADAVDRLTYLKHLADSVTIKQTTELVLDLRPVFHFCLTMNEPKEMENNSFGRLKEKS